MLVVPTVEQIPAMRLEIDELRRQVDASNKLVATLLERLNRQALRVDEMRYKVEPRRPQYWQLEDAMRYQR